MCNAVRLRDDFTASEVRALARRSKDSAQVCRLLSIGAIYDGMDRNAAARIGSMDRQTLCDWVHRFNDDGPYLDKDGVVRWRCLDLKKVIRERFGVDYHERTVGKILKELGFSHVSARPQHPGQDPAVIEDFKKTSPVPWRQQ